MKNGKLQNQPRSYKLWTGLLCSAMCLAGNPAAIFAEQGEPESLEYIETEGTTDADLTENVSFYDEEWFACLSRESMEEIEEKGYWVEYTAGEFLWLPDSWTPLPLSSEFTDPYVIFQAFDQELQKYVQVWQIDLVEMYGLELSDEEMSMTAKEVFEQEDETAIGDLLLAFQESYYDAKIIECNGRKAIGVYDLEEEEPTDNVVGIILPAEEGWKVNMLLLVPGMGEELYDTAYAVLNSFGAQMEGDFIQEAPEDRSSEKPLRAVSSMGMPPYSGFYDLYYTYDDQGNLRNTSSYSKDQVLISENTYVYDERGNKTEQKTRSISAEGDETESILSYQNEYEGTDQLQMVTIYEDEAFVSSVKYTYQEGHLVSEEFCNDAGEKTESKCYDYDEDGRLYRMTRYDADGNITFVHVYQYDRFGRKKLMVVSLDHEVMSCESYIYEEA